jgi:hypothetical protein
MKTLANTRSRSQCEKHFAVPLVGQWQCGIETIAEYAQWQLHLTLPRSPSPDFTTINHRQQP